MRAGICRVIATAALVLLASDGRAEQGPLDEAKGLYAAASFENALAAIGRLTADASNTPDALMYKALCLLALGRGAEAQTVTAALVSTAPAFVPPAGEDVSPRFVALLTETRQRMLPDITKRLFADARGEFHSEHEAEAIRQFEAVLALANDEVWSNRPEAADLRTLASGFLDLLRAPRDASRSREAAATTPLADAAPAGTLGTKGTYGLLPPVALAQPMPRWRPPDASSAQRHYTGAVRVRIGTDGHVISATMEIATRSDYDKLLLQAARSWVYKPAMRNGEPVEVEKLVTFSLTTN